MKNRFNQNSVLPMPIRFTSKTIKSESGCILWVGCIDEIGYGRFPFNGENKAHRVAYSYFIGDIPKGMKVLHKCDVRNCVNPDHLFLGTQADNVADMVKKGRNISIHLFGERNPMSKLTETHVIEIREMVKSGFKQIEACRKFGVSPMTVSRIIRGVTWK